MKQRETSSRGAIDCAPTAESNRDFYKTFSDAVAPRTYSILNNFYRSDVPKLLEELLG